ncbi:hypothetical protein BDW22DRAFT_1407426 [Trametopsis cervina]|nr:hypothetical protein BDW22DRAFT_1407426 [Trametopsis cervina]
MIGERRGWRMHTNVYHISKTAHGCALRFLSTIQGVNTPIFLDAGTADTRSYVLSTYIEGVHCGIAWDEFTDTDEARFVADMRDQFSALHAQTLSMNHPICNAAGSFIDDPRIPWVGEDQIDISTTEEFFRQTWIRLDLPHNRDTIRPAIEPVIVREVPVVFCHGDFVERNVILPGGLEAWRNGQTRACLIDWEFAGWMPRPWEALKATFVVVHANSRWLQLIKDIFSGVEPYLDADWLWRSKSRVMFI